MTKVKEFKFTEENLAKSCEVKAKYPENNQESAVMPLLDLAQRQVGGWLTREAMDYVANMLSMAPIRVYEVASFYTMYNLKPVGKYHIRVCSTTPCWLRGAGDIMAACEKELGIKKGETTENGMFTLGEVECLCACANAPVVQINDDYYEDLEEFTMRKLIADLRNGKKVKYGSQTGRCGTEPKEKE